MCVLSQVDRSSVSSDSSPPSEVQIFPGKKWSTHCKHMLMLNTQALMCTLLLKQPRTFVQKLFKGSFFFSCVASFSMLHHRLNWKRWSQRWKMQTKTLERHIESYTGFPWAHDWSFNSGSNTHVLKDANCLYHCVPFMLSTGILCVVWSTLDYLNMWKLWLITLTILLLRPYGAGGWSMFCYFIMLFDTF